MAEPDWLVEGFEENRARLRAVAYRMLGSLFTVSRGKITEIDVIVDPARLRQLDLSALGD